MNHEPQNVDALLGSALPTDPDSETALLSAVIIDPSNLDAIADLVSPDDFADPDHGRLFAALQVIHDAGLPISDASVLVPELKRLNVPEAVRNAGFIAHLIGRGVPYHATYYAKQVRRSEILRRQYAIAADLLARVTRPDADPADIGRWLDARLSAIGERVADPPRRLDDFAGELLAELRDTDPTRTRGTMTGLFRCDELAGGWQPGELVILAARTGVGKTALALQVAIHNAMRERPVLFVSLEMTGRELAARVLCGLSRVDSRLLRGGGLDQRHLAAIERATVQVGGVPLRIWAPHTATLPRIRAVAKQDAAAAGGLALVVVDYIGLVQPDDRTRPRHEQVAAVSAGLKRLAKELNAPVLALCQLNREADKSKPRLGHLRESGAIEQDADLVLFVHQDETDKTRAILDVAKHRHGETGEIDLRWLPEETRFDDCSAGEEWTG